MGVTFYFQYLLFENWVENFLRRILFFFFNFENLENLRNSEVISNFQFNFQTTMLKISRDFEDQERYFLCFKIFLRNRFFFYFICYLEDFFFPSPWQYISSNSDNYIFIYLFAYYYIFICFFFFSIYILHF